MAKEVITGAEALMRSLHNEGVKTIFGYPGGAVLEIYDAIYQQEQFRHILVRHEQAAIHAADAFARSRGTGKAGVLGKFAQVVLDKFPGRG